MQSSGAAQRPDGRNRPPEHLRVQLIDFREKESVSCVLCDSLAVTGTIARKGPVGRLAGRKSGLRSGWGSRGRAWSPRSALAVFGEAAGGFAGSGGGDVLSP